MDGFQYYNDILQFVPTSEGYYDFEKKQYIYNYVDHLGNVRLSYAKNGSTPQIIEESNYYPFGLKHEGYNNTGYQNPKYNYKYNGKELQDRLAAGALGVGLGVAALPKTIYALSTNKFGVAGAMLEIYLYYRASSQNVINTPSK